MTRYLRYRTFAVSDAVLAGMMADELQANGGTGLLEWGMPETQGAEDEGLQANAQNDGSEASAVQD